MGQGIAHFGFRREPTQILESATSDVQSGGENLWNAVRLVSSLTLRSAVK